MTLVENKTKAANKKHHPNETRNTPASNSVNNILCPDAPGYCHEEHKFRIL